MSDPTEGVNFDAFGEHATDHDDDPIYDRAISALRKRDERIERLEAELAEWESAWGNVSAELANAEAELAEMRRKLAEMHGARLTWADRALKAEQKIIEMRRTHRVQTHVLCETCGGKTIVYDRDGEIVRCPNPDCVDGYRLDDGVLRIERYRNHHVLILADSFTVEHPITCNLTACDVYTRCSNEWEGPPAPPGWHLIDVDTLELSEAEEREIAYVIPADLLDTDGVAEQ